MKHRRPLALAATAFIILGSLTLVSPAFAVDEEPVSITTSRETTVSTPGTSSAGTAPHTSAQLTISSPAGGWVTGPVASINGTGEPGEVVNLRTVSGEDGGMLNGRAPVEANGTWSVDLSMPLYSQVEPYTVTASVEGNSANAVSSTLKVVDEVSVISLYDGEQIPGALSPSSVTGYADPYLNSIGEQLELVLDGGSYDNQVFTVPVGKLLDENGNWAIGFGEQLPAGVYTLSTSERFVGEGRPTTLVSFKVDPVDPFELTVAGFEYVPVGFRTGGISEFSGTGEPGALITITVRHWSIDEYIEMYEKDEWTEPVRREYEVGVESDGTWGVQLSPPLGRTFFWVEVEQESETKPGRMAFGGHTLDAMTLDQVSDGDVFASSEAPNRLSGAIDPFFVSDVMLNPLVEPSSVPMFSAEAFALAQSASGDQSMLPAELYTAVLELDGNLYALGIEETGHWNLDLDEPLPVGMHTATLTMSFIDPILEHVANRMAPTVVNFEVKAAETGTGGSDDGVSNADGSGNSGGSADGSEFGGDESAAGDAAGADALGVADGGSVESGSAGAGRATDGGSANGEDGGKGGKSIVSTGAGRIMPTAFGAAALMMLGGALLMPRRNGRA